MAGGWAGLGGGGIHQLFRLAIFRHAEGVMKIEVLAAGVDRILAQRRGGPQRVFAAECAERVQRQRLTVDLVAVAIILILMFTVVM